MSFPLAPEKIAEILGAYVGPNMKVPDAGVQKILLHNVPANWPLIEAALLAREIYSERTAVATIATVIVETGTFEPLRERGGPQYLAGLYEGRADLGNSRIGDGVRFRGRGYVQITGRWDYAHFGEEVHQDLVANPDLALDPRVAAQILAAFLRERQVNAYADAEKWDVVRRRVNGGLNGWPRFIETVNKLLTALAAVGAQQA